MTTNLFLERTFDPPLKVEDVLAAGRQGAWCLEMYRVGWRVSLLAANGRRMACWFTASDAESARAALRQAGNDVRLLWPGTVHEGAVAEVPNVLVERSFDTSVTLEEIQSIEDAGAWCLQAHRVRFVLTFFSLDRKRMLCLYAAPDAESVRQAQHEAAMPVDDVWTFHLIDPAARPA